MYQSNNRGRTLFLSGLQSPQRIIRDKKSPKATPIDKDRNSSMASTGAGKNLTSQATGDDLLDVDRS